MEYEKIVLNPENTKSILEKLKNILTSDLPNNMVYVMKILTPQVHLQIA